MKQRQRPRIQNQHYVRLPGKDSDESADETELFVKKSVFQDVQTVDKVVEENDTLQALSIRYHCPIAELKRLNNIHRENEIFARKTVKVPVRPFSIALASVHTSGSNSPNETTDKGIDVEALSIKLNEELLTNLNHKVNLSNNSAEVNDVIFNSNVKPVSKSCDNIDLSFTNAVHLDEEVRLIPHTVPVDDLIVSKFSCSDSDISWVTLIICVVIVIVAVPLIYILYIAEHPENYHHPHS
ncbi:hypothetical protein FQR65_LT06768 [Abscondita terminalis]|nr:hypothetical protein FQR65_LT06768 [Abscondita terminalis]